MADAGTRRWLLLGLGALGALVRGPRAASAADGEALKAGESNEATAVTSLQVSLAGGAAWVVRQLGLGGAGIEVHGEPAVVCVGGRAQGDGSAGNGLEARGGQSRDSFGGGGIRAFGGSDAQPFTPPGHGAVADARGAAEHCAGLVGRGGDAVLTSGFGGYGVEALGGQVRSSAGGAPGIGVLATAGNAGPDPGASAVVAFARSQRDAAIVGENFGGGPAVLGHHSSHPPPAGAGVRGTSGRGPGGWFESQSGPGVVGVSDSGPGLRGTSRSSPGLAGQSWTDFGILGISESGAGARGRSTSGAGALCTSAALTQYAGIVFNHQAAGGDAGNGALGLRVLGDFVNLNAPKAVAVPTSEGIMLVHCLEAPVSIVEDLGTARLRGGRVHVALDPVFAELIDPDSYQVLLGARDGRCRGLAVVSRNARGFSVVEAQGGRGDYEFDYRVAGRRRGPLGARRLAAFQAPPVPGPDPEVDQHPSREAPIPPVDVRRRS